MRRTTTLAYPLAAIGFRLPGIDSPDFLPSFVLQGILDARTARCTRSPTSGEALSTASGSSTPVPARGAARLRDRRARARTATPMRWTAAREHRRRSTLQHGVPRDAVRVDETSADRRAGAQPQLDRGAGVRLVRHDRARRRAVDRSRARADRRRHAGSKSTTWPSTISIRAMRSSARSRRRPASLEAAPAARRSPGARTRWRRSR